MAEAKEVFGAFSACNHPFQADEYDAHTKQFLDAPLSNKEECDIMAHVSYTDDLLHTLESSALTLQPSSEEIDDGNGTCSDVPTPKSIKVTCLNLRMAEEISNAVPVEDAVSEGNHHCIQQDISSLVDSYIESQDLSQDKMNAVNTMRSHCEVIVHGRDDSEYEAPFLLITGGPGVGKSYLVKVINEVAKMMNAGEQVRGAYLGIMAVNIGDSSLCSLLDIPTEFNSTYS